MWKGQRSLALLIFSLSNLSLSLSLYIPPFALRRGQNWLWHQMIGCHLISSNWASAVTLVQLWSGCLSFDCRLILCSWHPGKPAFLNYGVDAWSLNAGKPMKEDKMLIHNERWMITAEFRKHFNYVFELLLWGTFLWKLRSLAAVDSRVKIWVLNRYFWWARTDGWMGIL